MPAANPPPLPFPDVKVAATYQGDHRRAVALLQGFSLFLHFLLNAEANHLCGVPLRAHSCERVNHRIGYHPRKLSTPIGAFAVRAPSLLNLCPRVSICKRAKRLAPEVLEILSQVLALPGGTTSVSSAKISSASSAAMTSASPAAAPSEAAVSGGDISALPRSPAFSSISLLSAAFIKLLWTIELSDGLLASLTGQLTPVFEAWRERTFRREREDMNGARQVSADDTGGSADDTEVVPPGGMADNAAFSPAAPAAAAAAAAAVPVAVPVAAFAYAVY